MNIAEIKTAVDAGRAVHWSNAGYVVRKDILGQYLIIFEPNGSAIGLTDRSGCRLNGREEDFFLSDRDVCTIPTDHRAKNGVRVW